MLDKQNTQPWHQYQVIFIHSYQQRSVPYVKGVAKISGWYYDPGTASDYMQTYKSW
jgi:hypothetical protein